MALAGPQMKAAIATAIRTPWMTLCLMIMSSHSCLGNGGEDIGIAVLDETACARERKMRTADLDIVCDDAVDQLAAGVDGHGSVLVVDALPFRMRRQERRH